MISGGTLPQPSSGKIISKFRCQIRSRHPSHSPLRRELPLLPFRTLIRLGSTTEVEDGLKRVELNSVQSIKNASSKYLMKECFNKLNVQTADWYKTTDGKTFGIGKSNGPSNLQINELPYPIVAKSHFGSRGEGNFLLNTQAELITWLKGKTLSNYIFEKFYNYNREYRLHVNSDGCFYTCRKMLKSGTPEDESWFRNDSNSVWIVESNPSFDKPVNWDSIVEQCVLALKAVGLDFGAVDLRIQSAKTTKGKVRENPDFIVIEINSAPSFGEITLAKYLEVLPLMLKKKFLEV